MTQDDPPAAMTLEACVTGFLQLAMRHPDEPPKTQRAERENTFTIHGFNRAQETLRDILATHGESEAVRALAAVRTDGQQQPIAGPGGRKMWVIA